MALSKRRFGVYILTALVCGGAIGTGLLTTVFDDYGHKAPVWIKMDHPPVESVKKAPPSTPPFFSDGVKRLPIAGREGFHIVVKPDGSSHLEDPQGKNIRTLTTAAEPPAKSAIDVQFAKQLAEKTSKSRAGGQLIVCDKGVVDVPIDAVITFIGEDRVVTHNSTGTAVVYFVDGRVEVRGQEKNTGKP